MYHFYGIYEIGKESVYVFMTETTYRRAYFSNKREAEEVCKRMNDTSQQRKYEVKEI